MKRMFRNIFFAALLVSTVAPAAQQAEPNTEAPFSFTEVVSVFLFSAIAGLAFHEGIAAWASDM